MQLSNEELDRLARELWTLGDLNRLRILALLPDCRDAAKPINVSTLAKTLGLSQPTVSNHLARLRTLGIVRHHKICRDVFYWIDRDISGSILAGLERALKMASCDPPAEKTASGMTK